MTKPHKQPGARHGLGDVQPGDPPADQSPDPSDRRTIDEFQLAPLSAATTKVTVSLVKQAADDLEHTRKLTNHSKTDLINKSIRLLAFVTAEQMAGSEFLLRKPDGEILLIKTF